jgi:alpha-ketoglutarate-dependent 2,4-dichlorophenoxyacetate dioxygenase
MSLKVTPIHGPFGAEISGVDLTRPLGEPDRAAIVAAMDRYGVGVFRDTGLDDDTHVAFSRIFGPLEQAPQPKDRRPRFGHPELFDAGNLAPGGGINQDELLRLFRLGDRLWHTDGSFKPGRSTYSLLLAHETPPNGGETGFADMRGAYDALAPGVKERIEDLEVIHSVWHSRRMAGYPLTEAEVDARGSATHRLVHVHSGSGRKSLYLAAHAREIVGWPREEGRALLKELSEFATQPQFVFAHSWRPGDLVIWDNLSTMHRGSPFDDKHHRRDMRRTSVREEAEPALA